MELALPVKQFHLSSSRWPAAGGTAMLAIYCSQYYLDIKNADPLPHPLSPGDLGVWESLVSPNTSESSIFFLFLLHVSISLLIPVIFFSILDSLSKCLWIILWLGLTWWVVCWPRLKDSFRRRWPCCVAFHGFCGVALQPWLNASYSWSYCKRSWEEMCIIALQSGCEQP